MLQMPTALHDQLIYIIRKSAMMWRFVFLVIPRTACPVLGDISRAHDMIHLYISACVFVLSVFPVLLNTAMPVLECYPWAGTYILVP